MISRDKMMVFLNKDFLCIAGDIDSDSSRTVLDSISYLMFQRGCPPITVLINSSGGRSRQGLTIYDAIKAYPNKTRAVVMEKACSMASVIVQACDERIMMPNAEFLIHQIAHIDPRLTSEKLKDEKWLKKTIKSLEINDVVCEKIFLERSSLSKKEFRKVFKNDESLNAHEALEFGFIDKIEDRPFECIKDCLIEKK